jgi:hypothetical protein
VAVALQSTDNAVGGPATDATNTFGPTITVDAGSDRCMVVAVHGEGDGAPGPPSVSSITFNGDALTLYGRAARSDWSWAEIWYLVAPDVGSFTLTVTLSENESFSVKAVVAQGVDQSTPLATVVTATGSATTTTQTVSGVVTDDLAFAALTLDATGHNPTPGTNETELYERDSVNGGCEGSFYTQAGADGGQFTPSWTTSCPFSIVAGAFKQAGGAPPATVRLLGTTGVGT